MWATITNGKIERREGTPSLEQMQEVVGGLIEAVRIDDDAPDDRELTLYVNEEGLMLRLDPLVALDTTGQPLFGPVVITVTDRRTGDTVPATEEEIDRVKLGPDSMIDFGAGRLLPILRLAGPGAV